NLPYAMLAIELIRHVERRLDDDPAPMTKRGEQRRARRGGKRDDSRRVGLRKAEERQTDETVPESRISGNTNDAVSLQAPGELTGEGEGVGRDVNDPGDATPLMPLQQRGEHEPLEPGMGI